MRFLSSVPRRWLIAGGGVIGALVLAALVLGVVYPRVGAWMIRDKVGNRLDLSFEDMGEHALKNIERPVRVYSVALGMAPAQPVLPPPSTLAEMLNLPRLSVTRSGRTACA